VSIGDSPAPLVRIQARLIQRVNEVLRMTRLAPDIARAAVSQGMRICICSVVAQRMAKPADPGFWFEGG